MKKLMLISLLALPLIGCASITDYFTPASLPDDALEFVGETNAPGKVFGLYHTKAQLMELQRDVGTTHRENVFDFQQAADREGLAFEIATETTSYSLSAANDLQSNYVDPLYNGAVSWAAGLLGLGVGGMFIKRPGDKSKKENVAEVTIAGMKDPAEFTTGKAVSVLG